MTEKKETGFKSVDIAYEEYGIIVVEVASDEEAKTYIEKTFAEVPSLRIVEIRDTTPEELESIQGVEAREKRTLN